MNVRGELEELVSRVLEGRKLDRVEYHRLMSELHLEELLELARRVRHRYRRNRVVSYSRKVFAPLITYCRDRCKYCGYRRDPGEAGAWVMDSDWVVGLARQGIKAGCTELLVMSGERPEVFPEVRRALRSWGFSSMVEYVCHICEVALRMGILPHSNLGTLSKGEMAELRRCNASLGLMLENISGRLRLPGGPHEEAPSKDPAVRRRVIEAAGELKIPFTTGILIGIGETDLEVVDSLLCIREIHEKYGHIQEVIVQNFRAKRGTPMENHPEPSMERMLRAIAIARIILGGMNIQAPPNLAAGSYAYYLDAGINDWGGVSPVTLDYVNPEAPWPAIKELEATCSSKGYRLRQRLPIYPEYVFREEYVDPHLRPFIESLADSDGYARVGGG